MCVGFDCPVCNTALTLVHTLQTCPTCLSIFNYQEASVGYVIECHTDPHRPFPFDGITMFSVRNGVDDPEWLVQEQHGGVVGLELYMVRPWYSRLTNTVK